MRLRRNASSRAEEEGNQPSPARPILKLSNFPISCLFLAYQIKKLSTTNTSVAGGVWQALKKSAEVENDLGVYRLIQRKLIIDTEIAGRVW